MQRNHARIPKQSLKYNEVMDDTKDSIDDQNSCLDCSFDIKINIFFSIVYLFKCPLTFIMAENTMYKVFKRL